MSRRFGECVARIPALRQIKRKFDCSRRVIMTTVTSLQPWSIKMRFVLALCAFAVLFGLSSARAGALDASPANDKPSISIGVYGDSLGDGVWSGLSGLLRKRENVRVYRRSKVGAGLTRGDFTQWLDDSRAQLLAEPIDHAILLFGANDQQGLRDENRKGYLFKTSSWEEQYSRRIGALISLLKERGATIVWLAIPIARNADFNENAVYLNALYRKIAQEQAVPFLKLDDTVTDTSGEFAAFLPDASNKLRQVRAEDGVHFTFYGYERMASKVLATIDVKP